MGFPGSAIWTVDDELQALRMFEAGQCLTEIGMALNRSAASAASRLSKKRRQSKMFAA